MTTTRIIGISDAARIKAALQGKVKYATTDHTRDTITFIFRTADARKASDIIASELER